MRALARHRGFHCEGRLLTDTREGQQAHTCIVSCGLVQSASSNLKWHSRGFIAARWTKKDSSLRYLCCTAASTWLRINLEGFTLAAWTRQQDPDFGKQHQRKKSFTSGEASSGVTRGAGTLQPHRIQVAVVTSKP